MRRNVTFALVLGAVLCGSVSAQDIGAMPPKESGWGRVDQKEIVVDGSGATVRCTVRIVSPGSKTDAYTSVLVNYTGSAANTCRFTSVASCPRAETYPATGSTVYTCNTGYSGACVSYSGTETSPGVYAGSSFALSNACRIPESPVIVQGIAVSQFTESPLASPCSTGSEYRRVKVLTGSHSRQVFIAYAGGVPSSDIDTPACVEIYGYATNHCASTEIPLIVATSVKVLPSSECSCASNPDFC